ncbi:Uncharacterised protein [Klebsiella pneumoniae]|uniref:Uncharacterized protein n=1 Tax=Klebsiella pneumoniae TaxID=573 RepID=A0A4P0XDQ4_KLEPN|nr:Uncharacterised protein [Klebsiella pneumoniae]
MPSSTFISASLCGPWLHVIEQIQLRDAVRTEIIEHYPRFCVAVAIEPDLCPET